MKNILFVFAALAILSSCNGAKTTDENSPTVDSTSATTVTTPSVDSVSLDTTKTK